MAEAIRVVIIDSLSVDFLHQFRAFGVKVISIHVTTVLVRGLGTWDDSWLTYLRLPDSRNKYPKNNSV